MRTPIDGPRERKKPRWRRRIALAIRRSATWLERNNPEWTDHVPSALASLLVHALILLILALLLWTGPGRGFHEFRGGFEAEGIDRDAGHDLTRLDDLESEGEPTNPIAEDRREPQVIEVVSATAEVPRLAPTDIIPPLLNPGAGAPLDAPAPFDASPAAPFSGRRGEGKARLLRSGGGNADSEAAVELGLEWLARHQEPDGSWKLDYHARCDREHPCPAEPCSIADPAATGLALLPMLSAGHTHAEPGRYRDTIQRGLSWLIAHQGKDGSIGFNARGTTAMYAHAIATIALCEAYGLTKDRRLRAPAQRAVRFIALAQDPIGGGWRYNPRQSGDTSVFGWQLMALRSGKLAGLSVAGTTVQKASHYLDVAAALPDGSAYGYRPRAIASPVMTAEALLCRQYLGWKPNRPSLVSGIESVFANLEQDSERNIYYWYYATQLLHNAGGPAWERWNGRMRDTLVATQVAEAGCRRGSWDPTGPSPDRWATSSGGRLYLTALSILSLEVYYRYLPLDRPPGDEMDRPDPVDAPPPEGRLAP